MVQRTFSDACPLVSHSYQAALRADPACYTPMSCLACEASRLENTSGRLVLGAQQGGQGLTTTARKGNRRG